MLDDGTRYIHDYDWPDAVARVESLPCNECGMVLVRLEPGSGPAAVLSVKHTREFALSLLTAADTAERISYRESGQ